MKRIKAVAGLMVLSGLCLCAFAASNASALTLHECIKASSGETAQQYKDSACKEKVAEKGEFRTVPIVGKKQVFPTLTETTFTEKTEGETNGVHAVLHTVIGGLSFQITCKAIASANSFVENKEIVEKEKKVMVFEGTGSTEFKECETVGTLKGICTVPKTLSTNPLTQTVSEMKVIFKPTEGTTFIEIPIEGASCPEAIKGKKPVTGEAVGTVTEAEPTSISFNKASGNKLKLGEVETQFTATIHFGTTVGGTPVLSAETP